MKNVSLKLTIAMVSICCGLNVAATTRTVNNKTLPVSPGQYSTIASAISASTAGDTIIVAGSVTPYDPVAVTLDRALVLIGAGYNPQGANKFATRVSSPFLVSTDASGSTIMGFEFDNQVITIIGSGSSYNNITFARNYFNLVNNIGLYFNNGDNASNLSIINNVFGNRCTMQLNNDNIVGSHISNNVFLSDGSSTASWYFITIVNNANLLYIDHNLFLAGSNATPLVTGYNLVNTYAVYANGGYNTNWISNNIFYNCNLIYSYYQQIMYNNISYSGSTTGLMEPGGTDWGVVGTGNINNTDPMLNNLFTSLTSVFNFNVDNIGLKPGSPAINAGDDGTNMGPTGGTYPIYSTNSTILTGEPALPEVTQITVTSGTTIPVGGNLNVTVKAKQLN